MNITFSVIPHLWEKEKIPPLRFVLKDRDSGTVLFHVTFTLVKIDDDKPKASSSTTHMQKVLKETNAEYDLD